MNGFFRLKNRSGFTVIEVIIALALIGAVVSIVLVYQRKAESDAKVSGMISAMAIMTSKIRAYYAPVGSYHGLSGTQANSMGLLVQPVSWDGSNVHDAWGNVMTVAGNAGGATPAFVITVGGGYVSPFTPFPLTAEECVSLATKLASDADFVYVGDWVAITVTDASVSGGKVYKAANLLSMANLTDAAGCGAANPTIALRYH